MANQRGSSSSDFHTVYVETNFDTRFALLVHNDDNISDFKDNLCKEHKKCFPQFGEINVSALKVKRRCQFYHLSDSLNLSKAFEGIRKNWFMYVDAVRVKKVETIMNADQNCSNPELLETVASDSVLVNGHAKYLTLEEDLKTEVKKTRKRKMESSDGKKSRKKPSIDINQSAVATTATRCDVDESQELCGKVQVEVVPSEYCAVSPIDSPMRAIQADMESGQNDDISMGENQKISNADGHTRVEVMDVQADQTLKETALDIRKSSGSDESHRSSRNVPIEQDLEKGEKTVELVKIDQKKDLAPTKDLVDGQINSGDDVNESHEQLDGFLSRATENDNERDEGSRLSPSAADNLQIAELGSYPGNQLEGTGPATEKKKKRKKSSKYDITKSTAATTTSKEIVNEINSEPGNVNCVDVTSRRETIVEVRQKEDEMGEKIDDDVGNGKVMPSAADNIQTDNFETYPENQLEAASGLKTGPTREKKRKHKKSSKDHISKSISREIVNKREKVSGSIDRVNVTSESSPHSGGEKLHDDTLVDASQIENEMGDKFVDHSGPTNNLQRSDLASTLVQESKTLDHIGRLTNENRTHEHEVAKDNVEIDADEVKSVKSTKKKKSRKVKTPAKEDTLVAFSTENVEPIKVVDEEEPDNVIRNVLDSLQERNKTEENLDKIGKKSSKKSKKKHSSNIVEAQALSVEENNATHEKSLPKDNDTSFTPAKEDTETDLKNSLVVADYSEDITPSKQILKENVDIGDNFGSSQTKKKQDQVTGGAKSKKEKKSLDLHPGGSIDGSLSSMTPKERKGSGQPASSGTSHLLSSVKNLRSRSKIDNSDVILKAAVNNKKESLKKSSNSVIVSKSKMNFFKDAEDLKSKTISDVSPSESSSDDDSDVTSMSRKQGNNLAGGTNRLSGSLQDILRSSRSYKKAKLRASQSQHDDDESPAIDVVPDSQAN